MKLVLVLLAMSLLVPASSVVAADHKQKAMNLVSMAVDMIQSQGLEKTLAAVNDPKGPFTDGEFYVYVFNYDGVNLAHGADSGLIGKNLIDLKDTDGVAFIRAHIEQARKGPGWVHYKWLNPVTGKVQDKSSYVMGVPGAQYWVGCGFYK